MLGRRCSFFMSVALLTLGASSSEVAISVVPIAPIEAAASAASGLPTIEKTARGTALPPYDFPWDDGLYGSAAGFLSVKDVCFPCARAYPLCVSSFCSKQITVQAVLQDHPAPLVVVLLGIGGRTSDNFSKLWPSWFAEAGYHVLTFESTFLQDFNAHSEHGVTGNLWRETELARDIIAAFLEQSGARDRIEKIGVVGISYGGVEALMLGAMIAQKKVPFEVSAIQSYSPPLNILHSAKLVDTWYAQTHNEFPVTKLVSLRQHVPDRSDPKSPYNEIELKAATAAIFHLELPALIAYNDVTYHTNKLPKGGDFDDRYVRETYADQWGFVRFAMSMCYPYWQKELKLSSLEPLIHAAELPALISAQPAGLTEVILAQDDPLDTPEDMSAFKTFAQGKPVIVLPRGGHVGFIAEDWTKAKLMTLFEGK